MNDRHDVAGNRRRQGRQRHGHGYIRGGFLAVTPGDAAAFAASAINWAGDGVTVAKETNGPTVLRRK